MNEEHQVLIHLMHTFLDSADSGEPATIQENLNKLGDYVVEHFEHEEAYLASIEYPKLDRHKDIHKKLLADFEGHKAEIEGSGEVPEAFRAFLTMWLKSHIMGIDRRYGDYAKAEGKPT